MGILDLLFPAIQTQESQNNPFAVSPKGAFGLMQLMPNTARDPGFGVKPFNFGASDPAAENQRVGRDYFTALYNKYQGDVPTALMAYNWGPGNVDKWLAGGRQGPVPAETQNYVTKIMSRVPTGDVADNAPPAPSPGIQPTTPFQGLSDTAKSWLANHGLASAQPLSQPMMQPMTLGSADTASVQDTAPQPPAPPPVLTQAIQTGPAPMAKSTPDPTDLTDPTLVSGGGILAGLTGGRGLLGLSPTARQMLMAFGGGLASGATQGWGAGIGAGLQNAQQAYMNRMGLAFKLQELELERRKALLMGIKDVPDLSGMHHLYSVNPDDNTAAPVDTGSGTGDLSAPPMAPAPAAAPQTPVQAPVTPPVAQPAPAPVTPLAASPVAAPAAAGSQFNEDALKQYPDIVQQRARAMAVGDLPIPASSRNNPLNNASLSALLAYTNGKPDTGAYSRKQAMNIAQSTGDIGKAANAFRAVTGHIIEGIQSINDVNNGPSKIWNAAKNEWVENVGGAGTIDKQNKLAQLKENIHTLASEAEKVWEVGGGSEGALKAWEDSFPINGPKQTQIAALQKLVDMIETKGQAIQGQVDQAVAGTSTPGIKIITPELKSLLDSVKKIDTSEFKTPNPAQVKLFQQLYSSTPPAHQAEVRKAFESRFGPADQYITQPGVTTMGM